MQGQTVDYRRTGSVFAIACYGMAEIFHVHAYLVFAACVKLDLKHGITRTTLDDLIAGHCKLTFRRIIGGIDLKLLVFGKITAYHSLILLYLPLDHGDVLAAYHHIIPVVLHDLLGLRIFGKHHKSRSITVKTMHDKELVARILPLYIVTHYRIGRAILDFVGSHREQPVAFFNHHDVIVLVDELYTAVTEHLESSRKIYLDTIIRLKLGVKLSHRHAVDSYLTVFKQFLYGGTLTCRHRGNQEVKQLLTACSMVCLYHVRTKTGALGTGLSGMGNFTWHLCIMTFYARLCGGWSF